MPARGQTPRINELMRSLGEGDAAAQLVDGDIDLVVHATATDEPSILSLGPGFVELLDVTTDLPVDVQRSVLLQEGMARPETYEEAA